MVPSQWSTRAIRGVLQVRTRTKLLAALVTVGTALAMMPAAALAQDSGSVTGVTDDEIVVSVISGFSGPFGALNKTAYDGLLTWRDEVNAAGGINGREVVLRDIDHKETADGGVAACKEALSNGSFFTVVPEGLEANLTATDCLDEAGMPSLYFAGTTDPNWKYAFSYIPTGVAQGKSVASFIKAKLAGSGKKVGVIYENTQTPEAGAKAFVKEAKKVGLDVVGQEAVEATQASFVPQLRRLKEAGAEIVFLSVVTEALGIFRDATQVGFTPEDFTGGGFTFDFIAGALKDGVKGAQGLRFGATVDSSTYKKYATKMAANDRGRGRTEDMEGFLHYGAGLLLGKILEQSGPTPTRESLLTGAEQIKNWKTGILPPITYGPGDHVGADASYPAVCCNDDFTWKGTGKPKATF
jgi:branched-chain amino acid transport system substrate-binding protein